MRYCDDPGGLWLDRGPSISMPTAIARLYTPAGFVIAADGRQADGLTKKVMNDSIQKIFPIEQPGRRLAYACAGTVAITKPETGAVLFNFISETKAAIDELQTVRSRSLWHFTKVLMELLSARLASAKAERLSGITDPMPEAESDTFIFIDGYYDGRPKKARIRFHHYGPAQSETDEDTSTEELDRGYQYGPPLIAELLNSEDGVLAAYRPTQLRTGLSLEAAVALANNRIRAHCDPLALTLDPDCWATGGHIHIATVTFKEGFQWVPGFEPLEMANQ